MRGGRGHTSLEKQQTVIAILVFFLHVRFSREFVFSDPRSISVAAFIPWILRIARAASLRHASTPSSAWVRQFGLTWQNVLDSYGFLKIDLLFRSMSSFLSQCAYLSSQPFDHRVSMNAPEGVGLATGLHRCRAASPSRTSARMLNVL